MSCTWKRFSEPLLRLVEREGQYAGVSEEGLL
jgi:hypothetical protein